MQNLRARRHPAGDFDSGFAEEDEACGVVRIRFAALLVNARPIKQLIATHIEDLQTFCGAIFKQIGRKPLLTYGNFDADTEWPDLQFPAIANLAVVRHRERDLVAARLQLTRKRDEDIGKHARSRQWPAFAADHEDFHRLTGLRLKG